MKKIICFLIGHKKSIPMLFEDNDVIFVRGCPRCKTPLGMPEVWKGCPPPPNSTKDQVISWENYKNQYYNKVRASII